MPSVQFNCPHCQLGLSVPERRAGTDVRCPDCKKAVSVPASSEPLKGRPPPPRPPKIDVPTDPVPVLEPVLQSPEIEAKPLSEASATVVNPPAEIPGGSLPEDSPADQSTQQRLDDLARRHRISLSRSVIYTQGALLAGVGLAGLFLGLLIGWGTSDDSLIQETRESATVLGRVTFAEDRFDTPDPGAVVIVLPSGILLSEKLPIDSLKPGDEPISGDDPIVKEIRMMGGDIARTGSNGQFRLRVPNGGSFYLLAISNNRPRKEVIKAKDLGEISRYFQGTSELIGNQSYRWTRESLKATQKIGILFP
jgi:hypothetical protein